MKRWLNWLKDRPRALALAATSLLALELLATGLSRISYPFDVGHFEAGVWMPAWLSATGRNPYAFAMQEPYVMAAYGYVYYLLVGVGLRWFGWQLWFGRLLTVLAAVVCAWCAGRLAWWVTKDRAAAYLAVLSWLAAMPLHHWLGVHRADLVALAFAWAGLALVWRAEKQQGWRVSLAGLLLAAAFLTKLTALLPWAIAVWRCWQVRRYGWSAGLLLGVPLVAGLVGYALDVTSRGGYRWQHFTALSQIPWSAAVSWHWVVSMAKSPAQWVVWGLLAWAAGRWLWASRQADKPRGAWVTALRSERGLVVSYLCLAGIIAITTAGRRGAYVNYYLEFMLVTAVAVAVAWRFLAEHAARPWVYATLLVLLALGGSFESWRMARAERHRWQSLPYYREVVARLRAATPPERPIFSVHSELAVAAGRTYHFGDYQQYQFTDMPALRELFARQLRSGRYGALVLMEAEVPDLPGYQRVHLSIPAPVKHYAVHLYLPVEQAEVR